MIYPSEQVKIVKKFSYCVMVSKMMLMISEIAGTKTHKNYKHESITERQI